MSATRVAERPRHEQLDPRTARTIRRLLQAGHDVYTEEGTRMVRITERWLRRHAGGES